MRSYRRSCMGYSCRSSVGRIYRTATSGLLALGKRTAAMPPLYNPDYRLLLKHAEYFYSAPKVRQEIYVSRICGKLYTRACTNDSLVLDHCAATCASQRNKAISWCHSSTCCDTHFSHAPHRFAI